VVPVNCLPVVPIKTFKVVYLFSILLDTIDTDSNGGDELSDEGLDVSQRLSDTLFQQNFDVTSEDFILGN
jgi:hypothetical protein